MVVVRLVKEELLKVKEQVSTLLERYPGTRDNDFYLQWLWLKNYGGLPSLPYLEWEKIRDLSGKLESVRRVRQKIQHNEGKFPPTDPEVEKRRMRRERKFREAISQI